MNFAKYTFATMLMLLSALPVLADDKKAEDKAAEKVESPWTEEQLKDFVKVGLKVTYNHKEPVSLQPGGVFNAPVVDVKEVGDKTVKVGLVEFEINAATERVVCKPVNLEHSPAWADARNGLFNHPVNFGGKLDTVQEKLKVGKTTYDCTVYTFVHDNGTDKDRWWLCTELPGIVLKYQNLGMVKINGAVVKEHVSEFYEATEIEIPKDSITPAEREKLNKKAAKEKKNSK